MSSDLFQVNRTLIDDQRFHLLVSGITDYAIYLLNPKGEISSWNAGAQRFKGYLADEVIGSHFSKFYTPEDQADGLPGRALQIAEKEGKYEAEGWRIRKDGSRFWAHVVIDAIKNPQGDVIAFAKITRDITERRAAQEALRESEQRFRLLVQGVTDYAIYMLSPAGAVTNWNQGAERIKGFVDTEVIGTHFSRFYTDEDRAQGMPARALEIARREGRYESEGWRVRKDGSRLWAHVVIDALHDDDGELIGFAKITRDITEKRKAAEALEQANAALFQAQKMEALGQLTGGVAHDFNNLLAVLSSSLDVISVKLKNQDDLRLLESMQRAIERGSMLTQQLLSFARRQPLQTEVININRLIGSFEAVLRRAGNSAIDFQIAMGAELRSVEIDTARFEASLLNLVVNARDAMPNGGQLAIITGNVDLGDGEVNQLPAGAYICVTVADTGTGMPPDVASRVFEPFFTTKEVGKGTGLGLSQVYGFITQSGGDVKIDTSVGKGTAIHLYLPAIERSMASGVDGASDEEHPSGHADEVSEKVLIVEDEPDLLNTATELFRNLGYDVLTASNGNDALSILKRSPDIDVLFTDVMMPNGMDGLELARLARESYPGIKILVASGYPPPALKAKDKNIDNFTFMNKPYRLADLAKKLRVAA
ncbi:PAS domain S-box protein [Oxalobacteraceae bacterium R-40]|uniref:histidine kinase n=1 Tax=Keguizhuia sedimenti TaxID=3064264 RepID=A0ABU1BP00_9BURK|nr:PAS domain S-box protein [Oxalobacteraceae bacterium R-40]